MLFEVVFSMYCVVIRALDLLLFVKGNVIRKL